MGRFIGKSIVHTLLHFGVLLLPKVAKCKCMISGGTCQTGYGAWTKDRLSRAGIFIYLFAMFEIVLVLVYAGRGVAGYGFC